MLDFPAALQRPTLFCAAMNTVDCESHAHKYTSPVDADELWSFNTCHVVSHTASVNLRLQVQPSHQAERFGNGICRGAGTIYQ